MKTTEFLFSQDDRAPDAFEYFEEEFISVTGLKVQEFIDKSTISLKNDGMTLVYTLNQWVLDISADDPFYNLHRELNYHSHIIVTGACGFVGSNLIKGLIENNPNVTILALDNCSTGDPTNLDSVKDCVNLHIVDVDLADPQSLDILQVKYEIELYTLCYHLAASIGVKEIHDHPNKSFRNSMRVTNNVIKMLAQYNCKIIYSSTSEVYGESVSPFKLLNGSDEHDNLSIHPTQSARSTYAASKLYSEHLIRCTIDDVCIVRFFNIVGLEQKHNYGHVIPNFIRNAKANEPLIVHDKGLSTRSYCYIDDAVNMLVALSCTNVKYEDIYNIGNTTNIIDTLDLAERIINFTKSDSIIKQVPFKEVYPNGSQIVVRYPITTRIDKLMVDLGMNCKPTLMHNIIEKLIS